MTKRASHAARAMSRRGRHIPKTGPIKRAVGKTSGVGPTVAGVQISHPDRLIYPDLEISKIDVAQYYERIAEWVVPHVAGRPLTLVHCPAGVAGPCHFLKHAKAWGPNALRRVVPLKRNRTVAECLEFSRVVSEGIDPNHRWQPR